MRRKQLVCAFILLAVVTVPGQDRKLSTADTDATFVQESTSRLKTELPAADVRDVETKSATWRSTMSATDLLVVSEAIYEAARKSGTRSVVTINTPTRAGATVKYQTLGERTRNEPPTTAKRPTEAIETMYLGMYHIWSERAGVATSDKNARYKISSAKETVSLEESQ